MWVKKKAPWKHQIWCCICPAWPHDWLFWVAVCPFLLCLAYIIWSRSAAKTSYEKQQRKNYKACCHWYQLLCSYFIFFIFITLHLPTCLQLHVYFQPRVLRSTFMAVGCWWRSFPKELKRSCGWFGFKMKTCSCWWHLRLKIMSSLMLS